MAGTDAAGNGRRIGGSSLISRVISSRLFGLAWSAGKIKAPSFSNSSKKLSRKGGGVGVKGFASGHLSVGDIHPWVIPWTALLSGPHEALCMRGGAGSLKVNLEMSKDYEVKKQKTKNKKMIIMHQNTETEKYRKGMVVNVKSILCCGLGLKIVC